MQSPVNFLTVEEYLKAEESSEIRHEYLGGQIFAMAGASEEHNLIAGNIIALLRPHLRGSLYRAFVSDMKVKVKTKKADIFYYPDIVVTCDPQDNERYFKTRPNLIIEVLSASTEITDRREKLLNYRTLENLQEYVLVSQDEIKVEVYHQDAQGNWSVQTLGKGNNLELNSIGLTLTMADIYEDVLTV
ncbi:Uma2 family endonuclease [Nostoc sphaeroides]|uniref:Uma2 family endonuclease n=1 Tax=Nostoc sphaeroides CCNUC1 TaxID=2653204 RepID=A0A5P8VQD7_9NOSO|nr:Uma2 family endonuclease [Nostoc sphaeroides]QFS42653.1 Uma2 family endonuclease [Nostoc sphaeroides CCNUC1]